MTTHRYIAFLRGINVGRAKRVAMADLRKLVADLGFVGVRSLLNSGNVVFAGRQVQPEAAAAGIEEALVLKLGVAARVTVLHAEELEELIAENTLLAQATDPSRLLVFILTRPQDRALVEPLVSSDWSPEALALGRRAAYAWCPAGVLESRSVVMLGKLLGDATTSRNWNTICKLHALATNELTT